MYLVWSRISCFSIIQFRDFPPPFLGFPLSSRVYTLPAVSNKTHAQGAPHHGTWVHGGIPQDLLKDSEFYGPFSVSSVLASIQWAVTAMKDERFMSIHISIVKEILLIDFYWMHEFSTSLPPQQTA
jgi:hypothetical protein